MQLDLKKNTLKSKVRKRGLSNNHFMILIYILILRNSFHSKAFWFSIVFIETGFYISSKKCVFINELYWPGFLMSSVFDNNTCASFCVWFFLLRELFIKSSKKCLDISIKNFLIIFWKTGAEIGCYFCFSCYEWKQDSIILIISYFQSSSDVSLFL